MPTIIEVLEGRVSQLESRLAATTLDLEAKVGSLGPPLAVAQKKIDSTAQTIGRVRSELEELITQAQRRADKGHNLAGTIARSIEVGAPTETRSGNALIEQFHVKIAKLVTVYARVYVMDGPNSFSIELPVKRANNGYVTYSLTYSQATETRPPRFHAQKQAVAVTLETSGAPRAMAGEALLQITYLANVS